MTRAVDDLRRHRGIALGLGVVAAVILVNAAVRQDIGRAVLYLTVIALGVVAIDLVLARWPAATRVVPVRGAGAELIVLAASFLGGLAWLYGRFVRDYRPGPGPLRLVWLFILIGCVFNVLPALVLLARRYGLGDLGLRWTGMQAAPLVMAIFAIAATVWSPGTMTWRALLEESGGSIASFVGTALLAAVPEEFFRVVWQTRLGAWLDRPAVGWFVASILWALLHAPKEWDESHSLSITLMGVVNIVPLGLLWGYLSHRSRSMLPSVVLHATNLWGLQNLA